MDARIIILNYEGKELLPACLPSVMEASRRAVDLTKVSILQNPGKSEESGLDYVREQFPEVDIWQADKNRILCSFNDYLPQVSEDVVILLNNDIRVDPDFVDPLLEHFKNHAQTFLVAPKCYNFEGSRIEAGPSRGYVQFGIFKCEARYKGYQQDLDKPGKTYSSGFGAFSREKFISLGGYRDWYLPGIMEDVDLCYRAKEEGYGLFYEPRSIVYHMGQASFKKEFGNQKVAELAHRNMFIFMWKNFKGFRFWAGHLFWLPIRLSVALLRGQKALLVGFIRALKRMPTL